MKARKFLVGSIVIVLIGAVIGVMAYIKNSTTDVTARSAEKNALVYSASNEAFDAPLDLTESLDLADLRSSGVPVIIDFGADSCIPCKAMAPVLDELHTELKGKAIIRFVDVWKYRHLAEGIPLHVIPTQIFFDAKGKPFVPSKDLMIPMKHYTLPETNEHLFTVHEGGLNKDQLLAVLYEMGMKK